MRDDELRDYEKAPLHGKLRGIKLPGIKMKSQRAKAKVRNNLTDMLVATEAPGDVSLMQRLGLPALVFMIATIPFLPILSNQFVEWDDYENLISNTHYRGLGWSQLKWMFTTFHMGPYQPLSWVSYGLDYLIWGMNPTGYHLTNLIFHAANGVFLYFVARRLIAAALSMAIDQEHWQLEAGAFFAALIFAIHPLRVESVAWATERRDVISGFFFIATIYCYLRAVSNARDRSKGWLAGALAAYIFSLLGKATAMTLPAILLILDIYPLRRLNGDLRAWWAPIQRGVFLEKIPFIIPAVAFAAVALVGQRQSTALKSLESYGIDARIAQSFYGTSFYLWKTLVPIWLSPLYEISPRFSAWDLAILAGAASTIIITIMLYLMRNRWPAGLACWAYYVVTLGPVLGIVSTGPQLVAERYSYLACLSWAVLAGGTLCYLFRRLPQKGNAALVMAAAIIVTGVLGALTWRQSTIWLDTGTLWNHVLKLDPNSSIAHYNLARFLAKQGNQAEAIAHYREALAIRPDDADTHNNLGLSLAIRGETGASLKEFQKAVQIDPHYAKAFFNLGRVYAREGELEKAADGYRQALKLSPDEADIYLGLANVLTRQGKPDEAVANLEQAIKLRPDFADAHVGLARALAAQGKKEEAEKHYQQALQILKSQNRTPPSS
jgi:Tfp pilus assembly protein PilF